MKLAYHNPPVERSDQLKGLMALLGGIELALVDVKRARSMHSPHAKDYNLQCAETALEAALRDFRRGNPVAMFTANGEES